MDAPPPNNHPRLPHARATQERHRLVAWGVKRRMKEPLLPKTQIPSSSSLEFTRGEDCSIRREGRRIGKGIFLARKDLGKEQ